MEIIISFIFAFITFWFGGGQVHIDSARDAAVTETATVVRVIDGDTIVVTIDDQEETIRYIGIDTPEPYREGEPACYSQEATIRNTELVSGTQVQLVADNEDRDRYDRLLRYVYVNDVFVNQRLVAEGYATTLSIPPNTRYAREFLELERVAQEQAAGMWSACSEKVSVSEVVIPAASQATQVDAKQLTDEQRVLLGRLGLDVDTIVVTPEMISCAESAVGIMRLAEITNGATPSFLEGVRLAACYVKS